MRRPSHGESYGTVPFVAEPAVLDCRRLPATPLDGRRNAKVDYPALRRTLGLEDR